MKQSAEVYDPTSWIRDYAPKNQREKEEKDHLLKLPDFFIGVGRSFPYHFTVSSMVYDPESKKILFMYHPIYQSFGWSGGHVEEEESLFTAVVRELYEETGLEYVQSLDHSPIALHLLPVKEHLRKGVTVDAHFHVNFTFAFTGKPRDALLHKGESEILWVPVTDFETYVNEEHMIPIYHEILERMV